MAQWPAIKRSGEFMASLANEARICIAVIAVRGRDIRGGFAGSGSGAEAEEGAPRGHLPRLSLLDPSCTSADNSVAPQQSAAQRVEAQARLSLPGPVWLLSRPTQMRETSDSDSQIPNGADNGETSLKVQTFVNYPQCTNCTHCNWLSM